MSDFKFISAANGANAKVIGMAYGGGKMNVGWGHPVVVDLAGMQIPENVPLLTNHENRTDCRIGLITASVNNNTLEISGEIISGTDAAQNIVAQAKSGAEWQLSIGADASKTKLVKGTATVNGQEISGPFYHVVESMLREVSVVAVGADVSTSLKIAAKFNLGENLMPSENETQVTTDVVTASQPPVAAPEESQSVVAAVEVDVKAAAAEAIQAERKRVADIRAICAGEFPDVEKEAIDAGWDTEKTCAETLKALRAKAPATGVNITVKNDVTSAKTLEAALALRSGIPESEIEASYGDKVLEAADKDRGISIRELMQECMKLEGKYSGRTFDNDSIAAGFSTAALSEILTNVANRKLMQAFKSQAPIAPKLCSVGDLTDFKESERLRLTDVGDLQPIAPGGELKHGELKEEKATNQLDTYGKVFVLTRQMIINDDLGALMQVPVAMGSKAARLVDQLFFSRLLANPNQSDGSKLFSTEHKNLLSGSNSALGIASLQQAIEMFLDQTDAGGAPISVEPRYLVVPTALKFLATELTKGNTLIATGNTAAVRSAMNALADENLQVVSSPYLSNASYTGNSRTGWYLFGDPSQVDTFEIGYLKGKRTPTIERGQTDYNTLGMWFRVYFDCGVREQGHYGMLKAVGA